MLRLYILESYWHLDYRGPDPAVIERLSKLEEVNDPIIQAVHPLVAAHRDGGGVHIELSNFTEPSRRAADAIAALVGLELLLE